MKALSPYQWLPSANVHGLKPVQSVGVTAHHSLSPPLAPERRPQPLTRHSSATHIWQKKNKSTFPSFRKKIKRELYLSSSWHEEKVCIPLLVFWKFIMQEEICAFNIAYVKCLCPGMWRQSLRGRQITKMVKLNWENIGIPTYHNQITLN